jgi:hypothetical protein
MAEAVILRFDSSVGAEQYWAVNEKLGIDMATGTGDFPDGIITHLGGTADDGSFVVAEIWESREAQGAFMQARLGDALAAGGVNVAPEVTWVRLLAHHTIV